MSEKCIFCQIIEGSIPSKKVSETGEFLAFCDVAPVAPTHILIIPKEHFASVAELDSQSSNLANKMFLFAHEVAQKEKIDGGYRLVINKGASAGQSVFHLHMHLLGGREMSWPPG